MAHVLLVDDERVARTMYSDFLIGAGHTVVAVGTIQDAQDALTRERFELVVTDLILPKTDGMEILGYVKAHHPGTEVIVITALDRVDPAVRAIKSGAADYLVKPVNPEALAHSIARALTTQSLLRENESLRRHIDLAETGQRIATTLDREHLWAVVAQAFQQVCECPCALVFARQTNGTMALATSYGTEDHDAAWTRSLTDTLNSIQSMDRSGMQIPSRDVTAPHKEAWIVPAREGNETYGAVVLAYPEQLSPAAKENAPFLARHLGLALRNLGRFAEVEDLAYLDDLTHLFNRRYLELFLGKEVTRCSENFAPFSLLFSDLDYLKAVNDTHGHVVGSKLLVEVARVMKACVRDNDIVCRWGGDEYVILLRGTDCGGALKVAERIRRSIETHHFLAREGYALRVTTCIGIASFPEHAKDKDSLLDFADRAMYRGKRSNRNVIYVASDGLEASPESRRKTQSPA